MNSDNYSQARNVLEKIKRLLLNYDLLIEYAKGELGIRAAYMDLNKKVKTKAGKKLFIVSKVEYERFSMFIDELNAAKSRLLNNLNNILEMFEDENKEIIRSYYFENRTIDEIAEEKNISKKYIDDVIKVFSSNIISFYF